MNNKTKSPPLRTKNPRILLFDLETMANLGYIWAKYEQDVISFKDHWYILTFAYKWLGEKTVYAHSLPEFPGYNKDKMNDKKLCQKLWELFDEADIIIAHNGNAFDIKKAQARFVQHGFKPPTPFKSIDTRLIAKRYFKFDSNKLDDLGWYLGLGRKLNTGGWDLWLGCAVRDEESSWRKMIKYNKQDVVLLEKIYLALRPWIQGHPNMNLLNNTTASCPNCGSSHVQRRGYGINLLTKYERLNCQVCGAWFKGKTKK